MSQLVLTPAMDDRRPLEPIKPAEGYDNGKWNNIFTKPGEFERMAEASNMRLGEDASTDQGDFPYRMAMATFLSEYKGMPFEDSLNVFDDEKERWAKSVNKTHATAKDMFDWTAEQFREDNKKQEAYNGVLQNVLKRSIEDALSGQDRPWMESIKPDLDATAGTLDDEQREDLLQKAQEVDIEARRTNWAIQDDARLLFRELQKTTGQVKPAEGEKTLSIGDLAERFADMPDERRKAIFNLVAAFGGLQGASKGFWYQMAESLGRGANVYYEGIPRNLSEDGLMDLKNEIEQTPDLIVTNTEKPFPVGLKTLDGGGVFQAPLEPTRTFNEFGRSVATILPQFRNNTRKATEADKQEMLKGINQQLAVLKVKREIRALADNEVDPIKSVTSLPNWIEQGLYGAVGSAPYTAAAMIPYIGFPAVYAAIYSQQKDDWINAGMPIDKARPLALTLAIPSAAIESLQATQLKRALPSLSGFFKSMTDPTRSNFYRFATQSILLNAEQAGQEYAQDSLSWFWQLAGSAIYNDVEKPTLPSASELTESALTTFVATFAMSLFSVGAIGFREVKRGRAAIQNKTALEQRGYSEHQIDRVLQAESEQEVRQVIQEEDQKRDPELVAKAAETILAKARDAGKLADVSNLGLPTVVRMDDGKYLVTGSNGEIIVEDADGLTAANVVDNALYRQLMQFAAVQKGLIDALTEAAGKDGIEVEFSVEEQKALDEMAGLTPEALAIRVAAWEAEHKTSAEGLSFVTMGLNNVQKVKEGLYRSINRVAKATRPEAVMAALEEHAEGIFKIALAQGDFTRDEAAQWLKDYTAETQDALLSKDFDSLDDDAKLQDLTEAMSAMSVAYFAGNVNRSRLNPKLRVFFERIAEMMRAVVARAIKIKQAQAAGAIGADFEGFLARSVGLDFDQIVEAHSRSAAEDFAGVERQTASIAPITEDEESAAMEDAVKDFERELTKPQQERLRRVAAKQFADVERENAEVLRAHDEEGKPLPAPNGKPSKLNRRQWIQVRTPLFKRWFGDWEGLARGDKSVNPDSVSKVVDENGEPMVVYHGTDGDFSIFSNEYLGRATRATSSRAGFVFSSTPRTAESYSHHAATTAAVERLVGESERLERQGKYDDAEAKMAEAEQLEADMREPDGRYRGQNIKPAFLSIKTPLVHDAQGETPSGIGGINPLIETAKSQRNDGVIISNLDDAVGLYDEIANHFFAFHSNQIKSATGNEGMFSGSENIRYSQAGGKKNLIVAHNMSATALRNVLKIGGIPVPSLAVINADTSQFDGFGEITLVGNSDLVNPLKDNDVRVFNADIYSPRYPRAQLILDENSRNNFERFLDQSGVPHNNRYGDSVDVMVEAIKDDGPVDGLRYRDRIALIFLKEKGITLTEDERHLAYTNAAKHPDYDQWIESLPERIGLTGEERIFDGFTYSGKRRYLPHNLDTVVRILKRKLKDGEGFNYGVSNIRATAAKKFRTVEQIQKSRDSIISTEDMARIKEETNQEFLELAKSIAPEESLETVADGLKALAQGGAKNIKFLREIYPNGAPYMEMRAFLEKLANLPTEYFEAKVRRSVQLDEFRAAVVPDSFPANLEKELTRRGLSIYRYKDNNKEERHAKVVQAAQESNVLFSRSGGQTNFQGMTREAVAKQIAEEYGVKEGGAFRVVAEGSAETGWEGRSIFDAQGNLLRIELNADNLHSPEDVRRVFEHELGHAATEKGGLREAITKLSEPERMQIAADMQQLGYDAADTKEADARAVDSLHEAWKGRTWFEKIVAPIYKIAQGLGLNLSEEKFRLLAERAAVRAVAAEIRKLASKGKQERSIFRQMLISLPKADRARVINLEGGGYLVPPDVNARLRADSRFAVGGDATLSIAPSEAQRRANVAITPETPIAKDIDGVAAVDIFASAKKRFGITSSIYEAGYVLPDGTMLDFSGKADAGYVQGADMRFRPPPRERDWMKDQRNTDHREVEWDGVPPYSEIWGSMVDFLRLGAIRVDANSGTISMHSRAAITSAQARVLKDIVIAADGAFLDLEDDSGNRTSLSLESGKWGRVQGILTQWANGKTPDPSRSFSIAPLHFADLEGALLAMDKDPVLRRERVALTLRRVKEIRQEFDEAREASQAQSEDQSWLESKLAEEKASAIADLNAEEEKEVLASKRRNAEKFALRAEKLDEADPKIKRLERESAKEGRQIERAAKAKFNERRKAVEADYNTRIADAQREAVARAKDSAKNDPMHFVEAIAHMEAIINMLPPEARANVGGYKRLASLKTADARVKYLQDRIAKVDEAMEEYLRKEFTKQIESLIEKAKPKLKPNKDLTGNLGGDVHQYVAKVDEAIHMTADQMSARMQAADIAITEADDSADISDLLQEWWILNTFGDLYTRDALHLDMARQELAEVIATGRRQWRMIEEARRDMYEKESDALAKDLKKKGKFTDPHVKTGDIIKQFFDGHLSLMQFLNRFTETPFLHRLKRRLAWAEQDIDIARSKHALALSDTIKKAIGPNASKADADRALHDLKTKLYAIEYQEGGKITKRRLSIDKAQEIIAGKGDLKALNLTAEDIAAIREQLKDAAKTKNKQRKSITWESKASTEKATKEVTRGQAIFLLMSWAQPDVREKMERGGWTEGDMTELAKITKDDVSRAIMGFLRETYQEMGDRAGEVFQRIFGAPMPRPFNYAPTRWENAQSLSDLSPLGDVIEASGITPGAVKTRQNHNADVRTVDAVDVFFQHIAQMEHWIAMAEINRDLRGVLLSKKVRQGIEATYGKPYLQAFERNVDAVMRGGALKAAELMADVRFISNIIAGKSIATLGFNMRTVFSQVDAFSRGAFAIPAKEYFKRLIDPNIWQKVPDAWKSETIQRRVIAGSNPQVRFVYDAGKVNPSTLLRLGAYSFQPTQYTDAYLTSVTAAIVYDYHYTESLKAGATEQMAKKFAEEEMMFAVYNFSQPIDRANRSSREISGNIFMRGYMMFMSDARLKSALMYEAVRNIAEGKGTSKDYRWIATIFAMALLTQASRNIFSGIFRPGDDDDDVWGSYARALMTAPFEGFLGMNTGVNALANVATGKKAYFGGKDPISNQFEIWHSASKDIGDVFQVDDIEAFLKEADKLTKAAAVHPTIATPAAVMNAVKDAKGLYDNLTEDDTHPRPKRRQNKR